MKHKTRDDLMTAVVALETTERERIVAPSACCDDPQCPGWGVFNRDQPEDERPHYEGDVQACDQCSRYPDDCAAARRVVELLVFRGLINHEDYRGVCADPECQLCWLRMMGFGLDATDPQLQAGTLFLNGDDGDPGGTTELLISMGVGNQPSQVGDTFKHRAQAIRALKRIVRDAEHVWYIDAAGWVQLPIDMKGDGKFHCPECSGSDVSFLEEVTRSRPINGVDSDGKLWLSIAGQVVDDAEPDHGSGRLHCNNCYWEADGAKMERYHWDVGAVPSEES